MLSNAPIIAFLATANAEKAREFYENCLGLTFVEENEFAIVFQSGDIEVRVQKVASFEPHAFTALGWDVASIEDTVQGLTNNGVVFSKIAALDQNDLGIWNSPSGAKVAWFKDPDGNTLSITQR